MILTIIRAENLRPTDLSGSSDPYVKVIFGEKEIGVTSVQRKSLNPIWSCIFHIDLSFNYSIWYVVLEIWDRDDYSADDCLGSCRIPLTYKKDEYKHKLWAKIVRGIHAQGEILVQIQYDDVDLDQLQTQRQLLSIHDVYPPYSPRFEHLYWHYPRCWHPDPMTRSSHVSSVILLPKDENILRRVEEVTLTYHSPELNLGVLAAMILTNFRLVFVPYKKGDQMGPQDVHYIPIAKIRETAVTQKKLSREKTVSVLQISNKDGSAYTVIVTPISRIRDKTDLTLEAEEMRSLQLRCLLDEMEWLNAENQFCVSCHDNKKNRSSLQALPFNEEISMASSQENEVIVIDQEEHNLETNKIYNEVTDHVTCGRACPFQLVEVKSEFTCQGTVTQQQNHRTLTQQSRWTQEFEGKKSGKMLIMDDLKENSSSQMVRPFVYDAKAEFDRQGIGLHHRWRYSTVNTDYDLCATYPKILVVPKEVSDACLMEGASYRAKNRLPVLTWLHPVTGAALCRSSQPKSGVFRSINPADINLIWAIHDASVPPNSSISDELPRKNMVVNIIDARPELNARGNALTGKGYETVKQYNRDGKPCATLSFMGIDNIHVVRSSLNALSDALYHVDDPHFFAAVHKCRWMEHVASILRGGVEVAQHLERGESVLVHCSDGWDRTAQLCALAQIILDPFYRTVDGFAVLVEKDWVSFGHMFRKRCRYPTTDQTSPIFLQFLDAVFQLTCQYPTHFQFNSLFLTVVCEGVYSSWFGNFQMDCEQERIDFLKSVPSINMWDAIRGKRDRYLNPLFNPPTGDVPSTNPIYPICSVRGLQLWVAQYQKALNHTRALQREAEMLRLIYKQEGDIARMSSLLSREQLMQLHIMQINLDIFSLESTLQLQDCPQEETYKNDDIPLEYETLRKDLLFAKNKLRNLQQQKRERDSQVSRNIFEFESFSYNLEGSLDLHYDHQISCGESLWTSSKSDAIQAAAPVWVQNEDAQFCKRCKKKFKTLYRNRHHCRSCGHVVCGKCSRSRMNLPQFGYDDFVRVCLTCYNSAGI